MNAALDVYVYAFKCKCIYLFLMLIAIDLPCPEALSLTQRCCSISEITQPRHLQILSVGKPSCPFKIILIRVP